MRRNIYTLGVFLTLMVLTLNGCSASFSTNSGKPTTNANSNIVANSTATNSNTTKKSANQPHRAKN